MIHVKAFRGSKGYVYCLGSEGLRSQAAITEPRFLPAPVLAALLFPWPKSEPLRRCAESGMKCLSYYTPSGHSIQAKGITPDIEVLQDVPDDLKSHIDTKGEASLRGHLKAEGAEETGSQSYVPPDEKDDKALKMALDLLRGATSDAAFPPNPKAAVPN